MRISVWGPRLEQAGLGAFPTGNFWLWRGLVARAGSLGTPVPPEQVPNPKHRISETPHFSLPPETRRDFPIGFSQSLWVYLLDTTREIMPTA